MDLVLTVLEVVTPVLILALLGYGWVRVGWDYPIAFVTRLAMTIAVPCLIFGALARTEVAPNALAQVLTAAVLGYAGITAVAWAGVTMAGLDRQTYLAPLIMGNTGNLGMPLALFAFGAAGLDLAVIVFAVRAIYSFTIGVWMVSGTSIMATLWKEPIVLATLAGALFLWQGWPVPRVIDNTITLTGQLAIPLMLLTLGVAISRLSVSRLMRATVLATLKVLVCAGVGYGVSVALALPAMASAVLIVQLSTPVAVTSYLLAEKYGAKADAVAELVVVSTLLSVGALPLLLFFLLPSV